MSSTIITVKILHVVLEIILQSMVSPSTFKPVKSLDFLGITGQEKQLQYAC